MPALAERVAELESILRPAKEEGRELSAKEQELLAELEQLRVTLGRKKLDKKDAMAEVSKLLDMFEQERELEKEKELQLKKAIKGLGEKNKELADQINQGDYQDALTKLREKMEELRKEIEEKKREGVSPEELEALEEMLRELEEIEAALMQLLQIDGDLQMMDGAIEFLENFEGDLADLDGMDPGEFMKPCDCDDPGT
jgi:chromosome segregation ATPase